MCTRWYTGSGASGKDAVASQTETAVEGHPIAHIPKKRRLSSPDFRATSDEKKPDRKSWDRGVPPQLDGSGAQGVSDISDKDVAYIKHETCKEEEHADNVLCKREEIDVASRKTASDSAGAP